MLSHLRNLYLRESSRSWVAVRRLASAALLKPQDEGEPEVDDSDAKKAPEDPKYDEWLSTEGKKYEDPFHRPRNWLGGEVPFPLNPSFKPPAPVSDHLRTIMYREYMSNPDTYNVRVLSERYGISMKRVDAILRLKGLEEHWKKNKPLQTGFLAGMETILGVTKDTSVNPHRGVAELGENASEADSMFEAEGNNSARERYQRLFWEPAVDGKELILPGLLEQEHAAREAAAAKRAIRFATFEEHVVDVPGRPSVKFVNVGQKYVDEHDQAWRLKERQRRSVLRQHKRQRKAAAALARKEQLVH